MDSVVKLRPRERVDEDERAILAIMTGLAPIRATKLVARAVGELALAVTVVRTSPSRRSSTCAPGLAVPRRVRPPLPRAAPSFGVVHGEDGCGFGVGDGGFDRVAAGFDGDDVAAGAVGEFDIEEAAGGDGLFADELVVEHDGDLFAGLGINEGFAAGRVNGRASAGWTMVRVKGTSLALVDLASLWASFFSPPWLPPWASLAGGWRIMRARVMARTTATIALKTSYPRIWSLVGMAGLA